MSYNYLGGKMNNIKITGYGDDLTINGIRIGDLSPFEHEQIEKEKGGNNYHPLENVVVSSVFDDTTFIARKPDPEKIKKFLEFELIDGLCCYSAVNPGQLNKTIVDAIVSHLQMEKIPTVPRSIRHKYMSALLIAVTAFTEMDKMVPKVAGVEGPEMMFKIARRWAYEQKGVPEGKALTIVAENNFHGRSMFAISASTDPLSRKDFGPFLPGIIKVPYNNIPAIEQAITENAEFLSAVILEPIQGEAGVIVPSDDYLPAVKKLCEEHNVLFCLDEVQTGYCRTGANFAHQLWNAKPDLMSCGKAAGGGIIPVSYVAGRADVIDVLSPGSEGSTFGGYPLACIAAVYSIKVMIEENLAEMARIRGKRLLKHFADIQKEFPNKMKETRGKGLLTAFEMYKAPQLDGHQVSLKLLKKGVYAKETHKSIVRVAPSLTITEKNIDTIAEAIRDVIKEL